MRGGYRSSGCARPGPASGAANEVAFLKAKAEARQRELLRKKEIKENRFYRRAFRYIKSFFDIGLTK